MPWRGGIILVLGLLVGGCALPAYQIASWTVTGLSYALSGKGVGDHALSLAMEQDCATWRILQGRDVCVEYEGEFEDSWSAMVSTWGTPDDPIGNGLAALDETDLGDGPVPALAAAPAAIETESSVNIAALPAQFDDTASDLEPAAARRGLNFGGLATPSSTVASTREKPWIQTISGERAIDFDGMAPIIATRPRAIENVSVAARPTSLNKRKPTVGIYLVIGSFKKRENAQRVGARHAKINTTVKAFDAGRRKWYRILAGPVEKAAMAGLRVNLAKAGIRNSWALRLCSGNLATPPCTPTVQQASLR